MEKELKIIFGKLLGEIYRTQYHIGSFKCKPEEARIYGLLNGFERTINEEFERIGWIDDDKQAVVEKVLNEYFRNPEKLKMFKGFYDIENELGRSGISRSDAIQIFRLLHAEGRFIEVLEKMDSTGSPSECRRFQLSDWDI